MSRRELERTNQETAGPTPRLRGRALLVSTLLLILGGVAYGGIFSANKFAASVSFPVFAYTFWIALFAGPEPVYIVDTLMCGRSLSMKQSRYLENGVM